MSAHFWQGNKQSNVVFVFSTPGKAEEKFNRPVSGETGEHMDKILGHLTTLLPDMFPCNDRYFYKITNASEDVLHAAVGNGKTENTDREILKSSNVNRVISEIGDTSIVILVGKKASLLQSRISGKRVVTTCHFGNTGLGNCYPNSHPYLKGINSPQQRTEKRLHLCALGIVDNLTNISS